MESHISQLERAFELARSGRCATVADIKRKLREEGYQDDQIEGPSLFAQLNSLMRKSAGRIGADPGSASRSNSA